MAEISRPRTPRVAVGDPVAMLPSVVDPMAYEIAYGVVERVIPGRIRYTPDEVVVRVLAEGGEPLAAPKTVTRSDWQVSPVPVSLFGDAAADGPGGGEG